MLLDRHLEKSANTGAYDYLSARGVHVRWAPAGTTFHQKTLTVDGATSVIMTLNLVARDYPGTRDFAVIDTGRADVADVAATFNADFAGQDITPPGGADLVWSPANARASVLSVIGGARHTLALWISGRLPERIAEQDPHRLAAAVSDLFVQAVLPPPRAAGSDTAL